MRRLLVFCALTAAIVAAFAAARMHRAATVSAAGGKAFTVQPTDPPGCPLGPSFTFCNQVPGVTSASETFQVTIQTATNGLTVTFSAVPGFAANFAAGDFTLVSNTCTGMLNPGAMCTYTINFSPTTTGLRMAVVTATNSSGTKNSFNVEGTGSNLALQRPLPLPACTQDNAFTYCVEPVGGASASQTFTLFSGTAVTGLNTAFAEVSGLGAEFNALQPDFTITGTTCGAALGAGGNCTISVEFAPQATGLREAALTVTDAQGDAVQILLAGQTTSGLTVTPPAGFSNTCFPAAGFQFCTEPSGGVSTSKTLIVTNVSGSQVSGLTIPLPPVPPAPPVATDFTVLNTTCGEVLNAASSCQMNVQFTPLATGLRQASLTVTDAQGDSGIANLAGTGDDFNLALAANQPIEVSATQGGSATFSAVVMPDNVFGQNGEQVTFACPTNLPTNTSCQVTPCPATVTPGKTTAFTIKFVTSTATTVAPVPTTGCSSYGPAPTSVPPAGPGPSMRAPRVPLLPAAALAAILAGMLGFAWRRRKRAAFALSAACAMAFALTACHRSSVTITSGTPVGETTMLVQGNALDANGNPLNASRQVEVMLDVISQ